MTDPFIRKHFTAKQLFLPQTKALGWGAQTYTRKQGLNAHQHQGCYEICYIAEGRLDWWVEDEVYQVTAGDIYITKPNEQHGGVDSMLHSSELYWLIIRLNEKQCFPGLGREQSQKIYQGFAALPTRCFSGNEKVKACFASLIKEHELVAPFSKSMARVTLYQLLIEVLRCAENQQEKQVSPLMQKAVQWMKTHVRDDYSIEEVADYVGLTVNHFQIRFRQEIGLTPADYRARHRIRLACYQLRETSHLVTKIAMDLGFNSSQYFATVFRKIVGTTPRAYRKKHLLDHH